MHFRKVIWILLIVIWIIYGLSVARANLPATASIMAGFVALLAAWKLWLQRQTRGTCTAHLAVFGLLVAIPIGLAVSLATPVEYIMDYKAYLHLANSLYNSGDYTDLYGTHAALPHATATVAWRPPGMALVYGLPIYLAVPAQISVWLINSLIALVVANFVRVSLFSANVPSMCLSTVAAAFVIGLACLPFFLLPISHLPAIATMILLLMLLPTDKSTLARLPSLYWLAAGILVGLSALFRPNLILLSIVLIALLIQVHAHSVRAIKQCAWTVSVLIVGILIAIAPWTARNWYVLERFVPISTNGGIVFYSANGSPDASAQGVDNPLLYEQLDRDVPDEVDRDREGWRRGLANIQRDPWTFLMSFRYRLPRLLRDPLYPVAYLRDQARGASWIWRLGIFEIATVLAFWWLWLELFRNRHAIRSRLFCASQVPWPHVAFLVVFASSLPFEISPNYQHSFLPFILFIWLSALADAKRAENVGVVGH